MTLGLFDTMPARDGAQRFLVDMARGLRARARPLAALLPPESLLAAPLDTLGVPVHAVTLPAWAAGGTGAWRPGLTDVVRLARLLRARGITHLFANTLPAAVLGGLALRLAGGRLCWRVHGTAELRAHPALARLALELCARVQVPTMAVAEALPRGDPARLQLTPPAIDLDAVSPALCAPRYGGPPVVGALGRWGHEEGLELLVQAMGLLLAGGRRGRLRLAGTPRTSREHRQRDLLLGVVRARGLERYISVEASPDDPVTFLGECDVVAIPTRRDGSGRLALEAAALGRPVVAARTEGLAELVEDGHTGLLVPAGRAHALADALELLLASPALRAEMGRQARIRAEEQFALTATLDALDAFVGIAPVTVVD